MSIQSNIYTGLWNGVGIAPTASFTGTVKIFQPGRRIKIKSITAWWDALDTTLQLVYPWRTGITQSFNLLIGSVGAGAQIAKAFTQVSGTAMSGTGNGFNLYEPGQYFFEGFVISNEINITLNIINRHATSTFNHSVNIVVDIDQSIIN